MRGHMLTAKKKIAPTTEARRINNDVIDQEVGMREPYDVERHMLDANTGNEWSMINPAHLLPAPSCYVDSITYALSRR